MVRHLLGPPGAHTHGGAHDDTHGGSHDDAHAASTLDLRIAAVFFIFVSGMIGAILPIAFLRRRRGGRGAPPAALLDSDAMRVLQAFAGATIAALAVVHVAPVAVETLAAMPLAVPYDHLGGAIVLVGLLLTVSADGLLAARAAPEPYKQMLRQALRMSSPSAAAADADGVTAASAGDKAERTAEERDGGGGGGGGGMMEVVVVPAVAAASAGKIPAAAEAAAAGDDSLQAFHSPHHHHHVCSRALSEQRFMAAALAAAAVAKDADADGGTSASASASPFAALRQRDERRAATLAYSLEIGCVLHSLLIGVAVGVSTAVPRSAVAALAAAVGVHQLIEGVALGCALARAPFSRARCAFMALVYSLTTPAGVALGIAVALTAYDPDSVAALAVTGVFSGLSAGLLLYLGLCQLLMEELSRDDLIVRPRLRYACHGAALLGGALMCILALWA